MFVWIDEAVMVEFTVSAFITNVLIFNVDAVIVELIVSVLPVMVENTI